jgi:chaperone required for assembly of F1-ATPase
MSRQDIIQDAFGERREPMDAARRSVRKQLRRRFYRAATVGEGVDGHPVLLDGQPARTPGRAVLAAPTRVLAEALAAEWDAQREVIDLAKMPLTRLANTIVDGVARAPGAVADEIAKYVASDLLFYRAGRPEGLVARQAQLWDPVLAWAHAELGARFLLSAGVMFVEQPERAVAAARAAIPSAAWPLGALHSVTTLTGSALLALALYHGVRTADEVWAAAHVDEDWNIEKWGIDEEVAARRASRLVDFRAAAQILNALKG